MWPLIIIFFDQLYYNVIVSYTKKVRSVYKRQPNILVVTAFKNGSREQSARVAAPNLQLVMHYFLIADCCQVHLQFLLRWLSLIAVSINDRRKIIKTEPVKSEDSNGSICCWNAVSYRVNLENRKSDSYSNLNLLLSVKLPFRWLFSGWNYVSQFPLSFLFPVIPEITFGEWQWCFLSLNVTLAELAVHLLSPFLEHQHHPG